MNQTTTTRSIAVLVAALASCVPAQGQQSGWAGGSGEAGAGGGSVAGTYVAQGAQIVLSENAGQVSGTASYGNLQGTLQGTLQGGQIVGTYSAQSGASGRFVATPTGDGGLQLAFDGGQPIAFARAGGSGTAPGVAAAPVPVEIGDEKIPPPRASAATGQPHRVDHEGWQVRTPARWKYAVQGGRVLFGSDTEAGFIVVWFIPNVTYQQMESQAAAGAAQIGMSLAGPPISDKMKGGRALITELLGTAPDGSKVRGRAIGVAGEAGVVAMVGLTTPEKLPALRARVDALARSVSFFKPKRSPAMNHLTGAWWHYHGTDVSSGGHYSGSSYERTIVLCTDGSFHDSDESDISVNTETRAASGSTDGWGNPVDKIYGSANSNRSDSGQGRWVAVGDDMNGSLELHFANGNVERRAYVFKKRGGGDIELDGRWYGRDPQKYQGCSDSR